MGKEEYPKGEETDSKDIATTAEGTDTLLDSARGREQKVGKTKDQERRVFWRRVWGRKLP